MKNLLLIICTVGLFLSSAHGSELERSVHDEEPKLISTEIHPEAGDYFVYTYQKLKAQSGKPIEKGSGPVRIEIQEVNDQGTTFSYHQILDIPKGQEKTLVGDLLRAGEYTLVVHADPSWERIEIVNFDEIHPRLIRVAELTAEMASVGESVANKKKIHDGIIGMFRDPQFAYSIAHKPVGLFFLGSGWSGYEGQERVIETELPNPLGGPALPALIRITLESIEAKGQTRLLYTQEFDPERVSDVMISIMSSMTQRLGVDNPELEWDPEGLNLLDEAIYIIDEKIGFLSSVVFKRTIEMNVPNQQSGERVEEYSWTLIEHGMLNDAP